MIEDELRNITSAFYTLETVVTTLTFEIQELNKNLTEIKRVANLLKQDKDEAV